MNKVKIYNFNYVLPFSADVIWKRLIHDFGDVADYANGLTSSSLLNQELKGKEGCQRLCNFDLEGKRFLVEQLRDVDIDKMQFTNLIIQAGKLPIVPNLSKSKIRLFKESANSCKMSIEVHFRTKPAFLARFMRGASKKQMTDLLIGMVHNLHTCEKVNKDNFKRISRSSSIAPIKTKEH